MRRTAATAIAILGLSAPAMAQEAQSPADAYRACLVGNAVVAVLLEGDEGGDAGIRALALCDYMVPSVPDAQDVEDAYIELWDERLVDLVAPEAE